MTFEKGMNWAVRPGAVFESETKTGFQPRRMDCLVRKIKGADNETRQVGFQALPMYFQGGKFNAPYFLSPLKKAEVQF